MLSLFDPQRQARVIAPYRARAPCCAAADSTSFDCDAQYGNTMKTRLALVCCILGKLIKNHKHKSTLALTFDAFGSCGGWSQAARFAAQPGMKET